LLKKYVLMSVFAASCAGVAVAAQNPSPSEPRQQPPTESPRPQPTTPAPTPSPAQAETREAAQGSTTTLSGCVYKEEDVAGRTPNAAERAGVMEDYILADVKPATGGSPSTPGAVGTSGTKASMYKLERIADERLSGLVGKRVEVMGRIDAEAGDTGRSPSTPGAGAPGAGAPGAGAPGGAPRPGEPGAGAPGAARPGDPGAGAPGGAPRPGDPGAGAPGASRPDQSIGPDKIDLPEFEVTSIREVQGGAPCPSKPSSR
jgi:translation initiation factor IF-2